METTFIAGKDEEKVLGQEAGASQTDSQSSARSKSRLAATYKWLPELKKKHPTIFPVTLTCVYLLLMFMAVLSYFYGSLFKASHRAHNLHILAVDYDNGPVGASLQKAYASLRGPQFISVDFKSSTDYPNAAAVSRALCDNKYWGALYTQSGASDQLSNTLSGANQGSSNVTDSLSFIYSGIHYPTVGASYILSGVERLTATTSSILFQDNAASYIAAANLSNPSSLQTLFSPLSTSIEVLYPAQQGTVVLLNTITMVIPPLMQFFYVMALDAVSTATRAFKRSSKLRVYVSRLIGSIIYAFCGSLAITGCIWAFRENWSLTGAQFVETWFAFWFYMDICYLVMDSVVGTLVPLAYVPFFVFTWVILNVTSTLFPFELNPGFYRWAYALPAHEIWWLLMQIWSRGCNSRLEVALPILFAWWVVGHFTSAIAVWRKCEAARKQ